MNLDKGLAKGIAKISQFVKMTTAERYPNGFLLTPLKQT
jgi:hypothetical protein